MLKINVDLQLSLDIFLEFTKGSINTLAGVCSKLLTYIYIDYIDILYMTLSNEFYYLLPINKWCQERCHDLVSGLGRADVRCLVLLVAVAAVRFNDGARGSNRETSIHPEQQDPCAKHYEQEEGECTISIKRFKSMGEF